MVKHDNIINFVNFSTSIMKLSTTSIAFIVQAVIILILFLIIVFKKKPEPYINYNQIRTDMQETINILKYDFDQLSNENTVLFNKIDSLKFAIPDHKRKLDRISKEINRLNETYTTINYRDSSDAALIRRLSKNK